MLYMFNVDVGIMLTFDINLGMELVSVLQEAIEKAHKIPIDMQVLLVSGGVTLPANQRVCHFSAGTDTNPIFLYNKEFYHNSSVDIPPELLMFDTGPALSDMNPEVDQCLVLPDTINTVVVRSHLAQKFCEMAQEESQICERLVHEQHLQHQGYAAVIANMDDTLPTVKANMEQFVQYYHEFLDTKKHYLNLAETVGEVANTLASIPLLPILVDLALQDPMLSVGSLEQFAGKKEISLLDWLHLRNSNDSFERLSQMCLKGIQQHTEEIVNSLQAVLNRALTHSLDENMRSIKGLSDRFSGLERLLKEVRTLLQEQGDLAKAFQQNSNRATDLRDVSILPDLCASHRRQLLVMLKNHQKIRDIRRRIIMAKKELIKNIYVRMKWVNGVETEIAAVFEKTSMYYNSLKLLKEQLNILQQTHSIPQLYLTAVSEVVRRRTFSQAFLLWSSDLACQLCAVHSEEVVRRQNFQSQFEGHMLNTLFPGLEDVPPTFATQAPDSFDTKLPKLSFEDIELLREKVPDLALSISVPDLSAITQFFLSKSITTTLKPKEVASIEERLVEVVTAVGLESNLDPTLLQPADSQTSAQSAGPSYNTQPISDRGFESETDTEEFEKVGQSPTDLAFDKQDVHSHCERTQALKEELQKTVLFLRQDLGSLKDWFFLEQENVRQFLQKLSYLYNTEVQKKNEEIFRLREELRSQTSELENTRCAIDELQQRMKMCLVSESREREERERLEEQREIDKGLNEVEKDRLVKEVTEQLHQDHKLEMEAVRSRFMRVMATASLERSPSECSLEKIEKPIDPETSETIAQVKAEMLLEKDRAVALERQKWQHKLEQEINEIKLRTDAEKQIWFNEAMRRILVEKDKQLEGLRERSLTLEAECQKYQNTINRLTATSGGSLGSDSSLLERVEALESAKIKLEAELAEARSTPPLHHITPCFQDMSTSIALIADTGSRDAATSPDPVRRPQFKEKLTKSTTSLIQQGKVSVGSCNEGDVVLVVWDETYKNYTILQESTSLYFLHSDSLSLMSLHLVSEGSPRRRYSLAEVIEREFCRARKPGNRYNVPEGTRFFRVKVKPLMSLPLQTQSSNT